MTHSINSIINPEGDYVRGEGYNYNINKMIATHELELARKVSLEIIRDCPEEIRASLEEAFDKALMGLA